MTTQTTQATTATDPTAGSAGTAPVNPTSVLGKDDFLKLLVAQLKYQDPMSPTDQTQFMAQLAQFSTVEGINNVESTLTEMSSANQVSQAVGLLGKDVTYLNADGTQSTGAADSISLQDGKVTVHVGGDDVALADIVQVDAPPPPVVNVTTTDSTGTTSTGTTDTTTSDTTTSTDTTTSGTGGA